MCPVWLFEKVLLPGNRGRLESEQEKGRRVLWTDRGGLRGLVASDTFMTGRCIRQEKFRHWW